MKYIFFSLLLTATIVCARPTERLEKTVPEIIRQEINHNGDQGYNFDIETSDGSKFKEVGDFKYKGGLTVRGSYEFIDEDGKVHKVVYEAGEKGFRPQIID